MGNVRFYSAVKMGRRMNAKIVDEQKTRFTKLAIGTVLLLVGVVIGVVAVFAFLLLNQSSREEIEASMLQESVKYITTEQQRLGINCSEFNTIIRDLLEKDIKPVLNAHQPGRNWYKDINADVRKRMDSQISNYAACGRLYSEAQRVKWDGLKGFEFTVNFQSSLMVLNTLIGYELCDVQDASCLDQRFLDVQDAVTKTENHLAPK